MTDLARMDATAQAELVREGEISPAELTEAAIERVEAVDPALNAVIHRLFEEGVEQAAGDLAEGPFRGVPFLFKDLGASLAGQPLHMGTRALKEAGFRAPLDWWLAQRFERAGFVTIGKTNVPELGIKPTTEPVVHGRTRNPWDAERTAGGSSGGAGAAVAAGMVPVAHASDGGGSIRIPASHCGLVGLKPTRGRSTHGPVLGDFGSGLSEEFVVTRTVRDLAAVLDAVHGPAPGDPYVAPPPARTYVEELAEAPRALRIRLQIDPGIEVEPDPEAVAAAREAAALLESLGHGVEEGDLEGLSALDLAGAFVMRFASGHAALVDQLGAILGRPLGPDDLEPMTWAVVEEARARSAPEYAAALNVHNAVSRAISGLLTSDADLLLTPTVGEPPPPLGALDDDPSDPLKSFRGSESLAMYTALFNATGHPAISLPLHWTDEGLPMGVQLVAEHGREDLLIGIAAQLERARPWAERTPPLFASGAASRDTAR